MDPYGIQDKEINEDKIIDKKVKKLQEKQLKLLCKEIEQTRVLLNNNIVKTDEIYDKLENGELCEINLNKNNEENKDKKSSISQIPNIFRLGWSESHDNIKLKINENRSRSNSDSTDAMIDFDIICDKNNDTSDNEEELNSEGEPENSPPTDPSSNILEYKKVEILQNTKIEPLKRELPKIVDHTKSKKSINSKIFSKNK